MPKDRAAGATPSTAALNDLRNQMLALTQRLDGYMSRKDARRMDDDDDRRDAEEDREEKKDARRKDKDFKEWAKEEEGEPEHKDSAKDAEGEEAPKEEKEHEDEEHEKGSEKDKRKDRRKDAEEGEGEPEPMAADDRRKDRRKDAKKDDDDDDDKRKDDDDDCDDDDRRDRRDDDDRRKDDDDRRDRADARADAATIRDLRRRLANLERGPSDEQLNALSASQHEWDKVAQAHGQRAPRPMNGEHPATYDRRLARMFQKHSPRWKDVDLSQMPVKVIADVIAPEIRTDSMKAAYHPVANTGGLQRTITREDQTGRRYYEFAGPINADNGTLAPFKMPAMRVRRINTNPNQY